MRHFRYLKTALIGVLLFVGVKMCLVHTPWKVQTEVSLSVILGLLASGIAASVLAGRRLPDETDETLDAEEATPVFSPADSIAPVLALPERAPARWHFWLRVWRSSRVLRRVSVLIAGAAVIGVGVVLSPLPGPQFAILGPLGLGILASEFLWARRVASYAAGHAVGVRGMLDRVLARISRLWIVPVVAWFWASAWLLSEYAPVPSYVVWTFAFSVFTPVCYVIYRWVSFGGQPR